MLGQPNSFYAGLAVGTLATLYQMQTDDPMERALTWIGIAAFSFTAYLISESSRSRVAESITKGCGYGVLAAGLFTQAHIALVEVPEMQEDLMRDDFSSQAI